MPNWPPASAVSVNPNLALIHYVRDYLREFGIDSRLTFDADGKKANLLAAIGPNIPGGIVLSGSNRTTAEQIAARIANAERMRASLIGDIELRLVPQPSRLLH